MVCSLRLLYAAIVYHPIQHFFNIVFFCNSSRHIWDTESMKISLRAARAELLLKRNSTWKGVAVLYFNFFLSLHCNWVHTHRKELRKRGRHKEEGVRGRGKGASEKEKDEAGTRNTCKKNLNRRHTMSKPARTVYGALVSKSFDLHLFSCLPWWLTVFSFFLTFSQVFYIDLLFYLSRSWTGPLC